MPKLVTNYITLYLCNSITYFIILHTHLGKNWVKTDRTIWPYVYRGIGVHFLLHDQSKVQCTLYAAWNANNIYKEKRKIWLESTHTDFLLIKIKNNFQLVCKLTHACILFMHSAIKCLTYAISIPVPCTTINISIPYACSSVSAIEAVSYTIHVSGKSCQIN